MNKETIKKRYFASKEQLDKIRDDMTLRRHRILSRAYKLGKKIWGPSFNKVQLTKDMGMKHTTVLRCLSLDKATPETWKLIKEKKISAFKVAQVCMSKNNKYQKQIVDMIIKDDLSTYQISKLRINGVKDVNKERHRIAAQKGYARKSTAYSNLNNWILRGKVFMMMDKKHFPDDKLPQLKKDLKKLCALIEKFIE